MFKFAVNAAVVAAMCLSVTAQGVVELTDSVTVGEGETFDGQGKTYVGKGMGDGGQSENQKQLFRLRNGATLKNLRIGYPAADGVGVFGDATFINVHWDDVGEDAMSIGGICDDSTHTVVVEGCSMAKAADKAFQVNARTNLFIRNFEANDVARFLACGVPVTVTIENAVINGGPSARYFIRANAPSSKVYLKDTVVNWENNRMIFFKMDESQLVDEGGNVIKGSDGGGPEWDYGPSDECGFNGGQPGGGARGTGGGVGATPAIAATPATPAIAAAPAEETVEAVPAEVETVEEVPAEVETVEEVPAEVETVEEVPVEEETVEEVPVEEETVEEVPVEEETEVEATDEEETGEVALAPADDVVPVVEETDQVAAVEKDVPASEVYDDTAEISPASVPLGVVGTPPAGVDKKPAKTPSTVSRLFAWLSWFKSSKSA